MPWAAAMRPMITMGTVSSGLDGGTGALDQLGNGFAQLRALALPVAHTLQLQAQCFLAFRHERIVEADTLNKAAIAAVTRIGHYHVVERTVLGAATGKTNDYHIKST